MGANLPGQSSRLWGQAIQVASCGSHSAGIRYPSWAGVLAGSFMGSVEEALGDRSVGVDPPVAEERPVPPRLLLEAGVAGGDEDLLRLAPRAGEHPAEGIGQERAPPELEPAAGGP